MNGFAVHGRRPCDPRSKAVSLEVCSCCVYCIRHITVNDALVFLSGDICYVYTAVCMCEHIVIPLLCLQLIFALTRSWAGERRL